MCGIVGLIQRHSPVDQRVLVAMRDELVSRGPDDAGIWLKRNVGLAHRRLSILDLTEAGHQPMRNEDGTIVIVFNGEIYNYQALRQQLAARHVFISQTDTEVLVHLYEEQANKFCQALEGMFAFGVYDDQRQVLTLARDRFGEKPLYYIHTPEVFAFASELKSLVRHPQVRRVLRLNRNSLAKYLTYGFVPSPHSLFAPIQKLEPATTLTFAIQAWQITGYQRYWDMPTSGQSEAPPESFSDTVLQVDHLIQRAVSSRLHADVPVGIFLSGGIDSSLVAANAVRAGQQLTAFTIAVDDPTIDESHEAAAVAQRLGVPHHIFQLSPDEMRTTCSRMFSYLDEPLADAALFLTAFLAQQAREYVKVVVSGDGGDELFGGYIKYRAQRIAQRAGLFVRNPVPALVARTIQGTAPHLAKFLSVSSQPFAARQYLWGSGSPPLNEIARLLKRDRLYSREVFEDTERALTHTTLRDPINASLYLDSRILLPDGYNTKTDRATMAASLELRSPLLDTQLAEAVARLPGSYKVRGKIGKVLLREIACHLVPTTVITQPKKGFGVPLNTWLRTHLKDTFLAQIMSPQLHDIIDRHQTQKLWQEHQSGQRDHQFTLLRLAMLGAALQRIPVRLP